MTNENRQQYKLVETEKALSEVLQLLPNVEYVALDTEADSLHHYYEKVCLIQLSLNGQNFIVDPLAEFDLTPLLEQLSRSYLILHGGEYDLRMLRSSFDYEHKAEVFDTMLAGQILGLEKLGLINLVELVLGLTLSKRGRKSDWSRRPLSEDQLSYACDDTRYLEEIAANLRDRLARLNRLEWHRESCTRMLGQTANSRPPKDAALIWRIKGHRTLTPRQLAVLRSIWHWREELAESADLPPFKIVGNATLLELSAWATSKEYKDNNWPRLPRPIKGPLFDKLKAAIKAGLKLPNDDLPRHRHGTHEATPDRRIVDALKKACAVIAAEHKIDTAVLAPRSMLEAIISSQATTVQKIVAETSAMQWQAELILPVVKRVLTEE